MINSFEFAFVCERVCACMRTSVLAYVGVFAGLSTFMRVFLRTGVHEFICACVRARLRVCAYFLAFMSTL